MKAVVYRQCGPPDVLGLEEIEKPIPGEGQVLIRVRAASINPLDWRLMRGGPLPARLFLGPRGKPATPGRDVAGEVEQVGPNVTSCAPGDAVFGCCRRALAEFAVASTSMVSKKPSTVSFEQAAAAPIAGLTALQALRDKGRLRPGEKALINGAAGGVGTFAVQIATWLGAEVTGVCSAGNAEMVRSLGADRVIDYGREDVTRRPERYDLLLENVGNLSLAECKRVLGPTGRCVIVGAAKELAVVARRLAGVLVLSLLRREPSVAAFVAKVKSDDLAALGEMMAAETVRPVIERRYALDEAREAFRYLETGHARGKVVITVS